MWISTNVILQCDMWSSSITDDIWNSSSFMFTIPSKKGFEYFHQINNSMFISICINISLLKLLLIISIPNVWVLYLFMTTKSMYLFCDINIRFLPFLHASQIHNRFNVQNKSIIILSVYRFSLCIFCLIFVCFNL